MGKPEVSSSPPSTTPPVYTPPKTGFLSFLPSFLVPFAELSRLEKPAGTAYLLIPGIWTSLLAGCIATPLAPALSVLNAIGLFTIGAVAMRGAGCTINDLYDRKLDRLVARTRLRPLARGAVSVPAAIVWAAVQVNLGGAVLFAFPLNAVLLALPSMILVCTYPLAKRVTNYPQFVLGMAFGWGTFLGFPVVGVTVVDFGLRLPGYEGGTETLAQVLSWDSLAALPAALSNMHITFGDANVLASVGLLYASCIAWTLLYDTIYAFQDIKDDGSAGIKSTAQAFSSVVYRRASAVGIPGSALTTSSAMSSTTSPPTDPRPKTVLTTLMVIQTALLAGSGYVLDMGPIFYVVSCGGCASTLIWMIRAVNLQDVKSCAWWFRMGCWITGGAISAGLAGEYALRNIDEKRRMREMGAF